MKGDPFQGAHSKRREPVVVLQAAELALDGSTPPVEIAEPLCVARDALEEHSPHPLSSGPRVTVGDGNARRRLILASFDD